MNAHQTPLPVIVIVAPLLAAFVIPVLGWWRRSAVYPLTVLVLLSSFVSSLLVAARVAEGGPVEYFMGGWPPPWGIEYRVDQLGAMMLVLLTFITLFVSIYSKDRIAVEVPDKEVLFYSVFLLLVCGLTGIVATADMFNLYVFLEITSLTGYALISIGRGAAVVAAFRYVILGTVGACFYLLSVGYLYSVTGTLNMADLSRLLPALYHTRVVLVAFAFFISGISIKMALFPMHSWLPAAYSEAPSTVSALLAATTTKVGAYVMVRVMFFVFEPRFSVSLVPLTMLLSWMGAVAMILGSVVAIAQTDIKRMLAYSSVAQIGYIVLGIGLANRMGFTGGLLHIVNHAVMKGCLFLVAGAVAYKTGLRTIKDFRNLSARMPWTSATFAIAAFSMIGIPPTCGFFSKLYLVLGAIDAGEWAFVGLLLLSSVLALAYFGNVIRYMYLPRVDEGGVESLAPEPVRQEAPLSMLVPMLAFAAAIILLGLFNGEVVSRFIEPIIPASFAR